jgi:hypothetical protein
MLEMTNEELIGQAATAHGLSVCQFKARCALGVIAQQEAAALVGYPAPASWELTADNGLMMGEDFYQWVRQCYASQYKGELTAIEAEQAIPESVLDDTTTPVWLEIPRYFSIPVEHRRALVEEFTTGAIDSEQCISKGKQLVQKFGRPRKGARVDYFAPDAVLGACRTGGPHV